MTDCTPAQARELANSLTENFKASTQGTWGKGASTHETVARNFDQQKYKIADFRHADDAQFCDTAHLLAPKISEVLLALANQVEALTAENANVLRASLYSADLATQAMEDVKALTAERDVLSAVVASYERVGIVSHDGMNAKVGWTKPVRHNTMLFAVKEPK